MGKLTWIELTEAEVAVMRSALAALRSVVPDRADDIAQLTTRLEHAISPSITVGVYGGVVQWVQGNPFPVRIIDYDGEGDDRPDTDDEGVPCSLSYVERDPDLVTAQG